MLNRIRCLQLPEDSRQPHTFQVAFGRLDSGAFLREKHQGLAMQTWELKRTPEAFAAPNIEGENFILGDAIKIPIGTKAKTARPAKRLRSFGAKDAHKMSIRGVVFPDCRHSIGRSKWILAGYDNVTVGGNG